MSRRNDDFGNWSRPGLPHKGWSCEDVEDLGAVEGICDMCGEREIRYVHYMTHPDYDGELRCGCVCAGKMSEDLEGARRREARYKNAAKRRANWLTRKGWRTSPKGNLWIRPKGYSVTIFRQGKEWRFGVSARDSSTDTVWARRSYETADAAKLGAFDVLVGLESRKQ